MVGIPSQLGLTLSSWMPLSTQCWMVQLHAACSMLHAACSMRHAPCRMPHGVAACSYCGGGPGALVSVGYHEFIIHSAIKFQRSKMFLPRSLVKIVGSLCDRQVAYSASDRQCSSYESCVSRAVSSHSSHHPQEVLLAQFSLYVHKGGLKSHSFHLWLVYNMEL